MTHNYIITGMTCSSCEASVKTALQSITDVESVDVDRIHNTAAIVMKRHVTTSALQEALGGTSSKYHIQEADHVHPVKDTRVLQDTDASSLPMPINWFTTYKPLLLVFAYITTGALIVSYSSVSHDSASHNLGSSTWHSFMQYFMAGFFLVFSFFKLLDIEGFATSYARYDIIARKFGVWGYIYPFIELLLGIAFLANYSMTALLWVTLAVMSVSIIGVIESVVNKKRIQCACLGTGFNVPMSTVTIVEDGLMIAMSAIMLIAS